MKLKTYVTIGILSALVLGVYGIHRSSYFAENRFVSDREMIKAAIEVEINRINAHTFSGTGRNPGERYLPVMSDYHFELLNPG